MEREKKEEDFKSKLISDFALVEDLNKFVWRILGRNVIISYRTKSLESIIHKLNIWEDRNKWKKMWELKIEDLGDIYWLTFEIDWEFEDVLKIAYEIHNFIISNSEVGEFKLTTKTANFQEIVKNIKDYDEAKKFFAEEKVEFFRKSSTSKNYSEIIKWNYIWNWLPVELKYILHWTRNQHWLSFQWVYAYWEKYLKWYVRWIIEKDSPTVSPSEAQIEIVVEHFLRHISEIIDENPEKKWTIVNDYKEELWGDLKEENFLEKNCVFDEKTLDRDLFKWLNSYFYSKAYPLPSK
jgi:hypothetical protein